VIHTADVKRLGIKESRKVRRSTRVRAFYDFQAKTLTIIKNGKAIPAPYGIMLSDVTFNVVEGSRVGCQPTGFLGFVTGNLVRSSMSQDDVNRALDGHAPARVFWDQDHFVTDVDGQGERVTATKRVIIQNKSIFSY
jgi:hypothetical protein